MGNVGHHLEVEVLSALADGELDLSAARNAQQHLSSCQSCATALAAFGRLDRALATPAPISCASAVDLRSALLDRELSAGEAAVAQAHLASCEPCRAEHAAWASAETAIRIMPIAFPSETVDARIARLTAPAGRSRFPLTPRLVGGAGLRAGLAAHHTKILLVVRNDRIVYEWYAADSGPGKRHYTASMAKAMFSYAVRPGRSRKS